MGRSRRRAHPDVVLPPLSPNEESVWIASHAGRRARFLALYLQIYSRPDYKSDATIIYGTQVENTDLFPQQATLVAEWNKMYAYPRLQYSGFAEAMGYIAGQFGDSIPVVRGDGGPYWEDGIASTARSAALERENEQRALAAEKFSTLSSLVNPRLRPDAEAIKELWNDMVLYDEHTWGDHRSVTESREPGDPAAVGPQGGLRQRSEEPR